MIMSQKKRKKQKINQYIDQWNVGSRSKSKQTDIKEISRIYASQECTDSGIDDITWNDLAMDSLYSEMNNCVTAAGDYELYTVLRKPVYEEKELIKRDKAISFLHVNENVRNEKKYLLEMTGNNSVFVVEDCRKEMEEVKISRWKPILGMALFVLSIGIVVYNATIGIFILAFVALLNIILHAGMRNQIECFVPVINQISSMITHSSEIAEETGSEALDDILVDIRFSKKDVRKYQKISQMMNVQLGGTYSEMDYAVEYIRCFFHIDIWAFLKFRKEFGHDFEMLAKCIKSMGRLDAFISVAEYRNSLIKRGSYYCKPLFGGNGIEVDEGINPLIKDCVSNDFCFEKNILITGSNATGKSTYLRTVAVNCIMAQTVYTVCAKKYYADFFRIVTSMNINDNILSGDSSFMAEIKSIKRILDKRNSSVKVLCCIDEILKGTNTIERISAAAEIMKEIAEGNFLCIVSSHDLELTGLVGDKYDFYYFTEKIGKHGLENDFKLKKGISNERNAIKLLNLLGFSTDVVQCAKERADRYISTGSWA